MDLYNILSINGIDIDQYLGGGSEINEIKNNTFNLSNSFTSLNNNDLNSNIRIFEQSKYDIYCINKYGNLQDMIITFDRDNENSSYINGIKSRILMLNDAFDA